MNEEKGFLTVACQDVILAKITKAIANEKPAVRVIVPIAIKALFAIGDDKYANKLPQPVLVGSRSFFDAILVENDIPKAVTIAIDLVPVIYELFKKPEEVAPVGVVSHT